MIYLRSIIELFFQTVRLNNALFTHSTGLGVGVLPVPGVRSRKKDLGGVRVRGDISWFRKSERRWPSGGRFKIV